MHCGKDYQESISFVVVVNIYIINYNYIELCNSMYNYI